MITHEELATLLSRFDASELSRVSGVSRKTVQRLRLRQNSPSLATVQKLLAAVSSIQKSIGAR